MKPANGVSRRGALTAALSLPMVSGLSAASVAQPSRSRTLVAYVSRTGNTRVIAHQIRRAHDADLFEIRPAVPYPEDYEATVSQASEEREAGFEPPLDAHIPDIGRYDVVFLGFPIWGMTPPPVIRSFLSSHDLSSKLLVPFVTHGGYGLGGSMTVIARHAPKADLRDGFVLRADQERETLAQVTEWLGGMAIGTDAQ
ncbi:flavodoxin [Marinivivus vitaminiproducens]|uniref:flavodoxin n=1 Tax=Marinivivus vitaminiproducens TaxID=3035935 RepID=UPI0027A788DB|nr:flavodoxin [Geminicoccaceae bacterium SCSIO 64248]